jgi:hypothetical protein
MPTYCSKIRKLVRHQGLPCNTTFRSEVSATKGRKNITWARTSHNQPFLCTAFVPSNAKVEDKLPWVSTKVIRIGGLILRKESIARQSRMKTPYSSNNLIDIVPATTLKERGNRFCESWVASGAILADSLTNSTPGRVQMTLALPTTRPRHLSDDIQHCCHRTYYQAEFCLTRHDFQMVIGHQRGILWAFWDFRRDSKLLWLAWNVIRSTFLALMNRSTVIA